jgi:hypothetical protein
VGPDGGLWYVKQGFPIGEVRRIRPDGSSGTNGEGLGPASGTSLAITGNPVRSGSPVRIGYALPRATSLAISVHRVSGTRVATLFQGRQSPGAHRVDWNGLDPRGLPVAAGAYFVRIETDEGATAKAKVTVVK